MTRHTGSPRIRGKLAGNRGLAVVEFAITMPLVLFLLFATAEIGRALYQYTALNKAVQDGARYLSGKAFLVANSAFFEGKEKPIAINVTVYGTNFPDDSQPGPPVLPGFKPSDVTAEAILGTQFVRVQATYEFQPLFVTIPSFGYGSPPALTTFTATATQKVLR